MKQRALPWALTGLLSLSGTAALADNLGRIYELALENDASLKAAEATYRANLETENIARSALLPQISGAATYNANDTEATRGADPTQGNPAFTADVDIDTTTYSLSLTQNLFDLPSWFTFKSGKSTSAQARAQLAADQQDLIVRVAEGYFNVLRARANLEASQAEERAANRQLEQTQQRFDVGLIAITDVHEARAVYDNTVAQRLGFEANLGTALEALSVLTGQMHSGLPILGEDFPITTPHPADRATWVDFALQNNYLLRATQHAVEASHRIAKAKKAEHLPSLTGSLNYSDSNEERATDTVLLNFENDNEAESTVFRLDLTIPIYSGGGVSATRRQAYEQYNAALQEQILTRRQVVQQTRSLHLTVATDVQRVKARKQNIVSAESALDATKSGYEVGTRNIVDVLQSQRALFAAIRDYANARFDYVINMLRLKQQAGILSPDDIYMLNKWLIPEQAEQ